MTKIFDTLEKFIKYVCRCVGHFEMFSTKALNNSINSIIQESFLDENVDSQNTMCF